MADFIKIPATSCPICDWQIEQAARSGGLPGKDEHHPFWGDPKVRWIVHRQGHHVHFKKVVHMRMVHGYAYMVPHTIEELQQAAWQAKWLNKTEVKTTKKKAVRQMKLID